MDAHDHDNRDDNEFVEFVPLQPDDECPDDCWVLQEDGSLQSGCWGIDKNGNEVIAYISSTAPLPPELKKARAKVNSFLSSILTTAQMWALEPQRFTIDGVILQGDNQYRDGAKLGVVMALYGPSGIGKSYLLISWLLCLVTGTVWCGRAVVKTFALYFTDEGLRGIGTRERGWCARHGYKGIPEYPHCIRMLNILDDEAVQAVGQEIAGWPNRPGLIAIDTFGSATATGDEVKDMPRAMTNARRLSILTGAAVLLNHHPDKAGKWERGGGQFRNRLDLLIEIETVPKAPSFRQLTFHKVRDDKQPETMLIEYCEQPVHTPWGVKTTLVVEGPRTMMDLPAEAIGFLEKVIVTEFDDRFPDGTAIYTELYNAVDAATADLRERKGAHLDKTAFGKALNNVVKSGQIIDEAADRPEGQQRPKGSLYRRAEGGRRPQPATREEESVGAGKIGRYEAVPLGTASLPTDLPTRFGSVDPSLPIPTDRSTGGSEVEPRLKKASESKVPSAPEVDDLVATGRAHLGPTEPDDEKQPKVK
jgi:hypothetical protein